MRDQGGAGRVGVAETEEDESSPHGTAAASAALPTLLMGGK